MSMGQVVRNLYAEILVLWVCWSFVHSVGLRLVRHRANWSPVGLDFHSVE